MLLQVWPVVPLVLVLVDEAVLAQDAVLDVLVVAQHLAQLDLWRGGQVLDVLCCARYCNLHIL